MVALLALSAPFVYADSGNGGNFGDGSGWGHHGHSWRGADSFHNLTDDQKKQMKDYLAETKGSQEDSF
jgi:Spy/CpxP family protein refolding chaperone